MKVLRATLTERLHLAEQEGEFSQPIRIPITLGSDINVDLIPETGTITGPDGNQIAGRQFLRIIDRLGIINAELTQTGPLTATLNTGENQYRLDYEKIPSIPGWQREEAAEEPAPDAEQPPAPPTATAPQAGGTASRMAHAVAQVSALRLALSAEGDSETTQAVENALSWLRQASNRISPPEPEPEPAQPSPSTRPDKKKTKHRSFRMTR